MSCEICRQQPATEFMVVRQTRRDGGERVAKAHVCLRCLEEVARDDVPEGQERNGGELRVESVSAQDYADVIENHDRTN